MDLLFAQGCFPEGISFSTQTQIDNFQYSYPGCTEIDGNVKIEGVVTITNLNGLSVLTSISGNLEIGNSTHGTTSLINLEGLNNLVYVGGNLTIHTNDQHINLTGLDHLTSIGNNLIITGNLSLKSILGLNNLTSIGGSVKFNGNRLTSLAGLEKVTTIPGHLRI